VALGLRMNVYRYLRLPHSRPLAAIAVLAVFALVACTTGGAATRQTGHTYYVSTTGSDGAAGSLDHPWRTPQHGLDVMHAGDRILLLGGTYSTGALYASQNGTSSAPVELGAYGGQQVVIRGSIRIAAAYFTLSNLILDGSTSPGQVLISISAGHVTVTGNEVRNSTMSGIYIGGASSFRIVGNWVHDNGSHLVGSVPQDHGIYVEQGRSGLIANNIIEHNFGYGVQLYPEPSKTLVTENTIVANGLQQSGSQGASGVVIGGSGASGNTVADNIVVGNGEIAIRSLKPVGSGNKVLDNLGYGNAMGDFPAGFYTAGLSYKMNFSAAPHFVDPMNHDYRLQADSPARDRALKKYATKTDYAGHTRSHPDLGAFEYVATSRRAAKP
jgi:parallel beta-helix repeat protein